MRRARHGKAVEKQHGEGGSRSRHRPWNPKRGRGFLGLFEGEGRLRLLPMSPMSEALYAHLPAAESWERPRRAAVDQPLIEVANIVIAVLALIFVAPILLGVGLGI